MKRSAADRAIDALAAIGMLAVIVSLVAMIWSIALTPGMLPANAWWTPWAVSALGAIVAAIVIVHAVDTWARRP